MVHPDKIFGRLGNRMFQMAFAYAYARDHEIDYYYQDPDFFIGYEDEIKTLFGEGVEKINMVSIHVRRGKNPANASEPSYSSNPFYVNLCATDYYERAVEMFGDKQFLVFSDDIEYCKQMFTGKQFTFCEEEDDIKAFNLMAGCEAHIIANSSFSWWAAYVGGGKTIAPKKYYSDGIERTKYPSEWIKI